MPAPDSVDVAPGVPTIDVPETMARDTADAPAPRAPRTLGTDHTPAGLRDDDGELQRYQLGSELGRGGAGQVLAAVDRRLRRDLAIKWLHDESTDSRSKFIEEAQITGQLQHPNIIPVYELGNDGDGRPFLAMKRVHGRSFGETIRLSHRRTRTRQNRYDRTLVTRELRRLLEVFLKVCDAVAYAHSRGVIHRDLKPSNVMVGEFGEVLVVDWGLARPIGATDPDETRTGGNGAPGSRAFAVTADGSRKVISDRRSSDANPAELTQVGHIKGTPGYMAPEQATAPSNELDEGVDIHALGGILYSILTAKPPVEAANTQDMLVAVLEHRLTPPLAIGPREWVPRELDAVVQRAMSRRRRERYATVAELKDDIERYLDGHTVLAARYSPLQRLTKWAARHRALVLGAAASVFVAVIGLGVALWLVEAGKVAQLEEQARTAAERARTEAERRDRELAEARARAQQAETEALAEQLGERLRADGKDVRDEFNRLYAQALNAGTPWRLFIRRLPRPRLVGFVRAYEALVTLHEEHPDQVPLTAEEWFMAALLRDQDGRLDDALGAYTRSLELDDRAVQTLQNRGEILYRLRRYNDALADFRRVTVVQEDFAAAHFNIGNTLATLGRPDEALDAFRAAVQHDPDLFLGHIGVASVLADLGRIDEAMPHADRAVQLAPFDAQTFAVRGMLRHDRDDYLGALQDFDKALAIDDQLAHVHTNRAMANYHLGRLDEAGRDVERALALEPGYRKAIRMRGQIRLAGGRDLALALADFEHCLRENPDDLDVRYQLGAALLQMGRHGDARPHFERVLAANPAHHPAIAALGNVQLAEDNLPGALELYSRAIQLEPDDPTYRYGRSIVYAQTGRVEDAIADLDVAIRVAPDVADYLNQRGAMRQSIGQLDGALDDFNRLLELTPRDPRGLTNRAIVRLGLGQPEGAERDATQSLRERPDDWQTLLVRGSARANLGKADEARADFARAEELAPEASKPAVRDARDASLGD